MTTTPRNLRGSTSTEMLDLDVVARADVDADLLARSMATVGVRG